MSKTCRNCLFWRSPHEGYWDSDKMGKCLAMEPDEDIILKQNSRVCGLLEGCVDVFDKRPDFEFVTGENFGCIHFKKK